MLEGKYWKRKTEAVALEYRKWRYYREKDVSLKKSGLPSLAGSLHPLGHSAVGQKEEGRSISGCLARKS